MLSILFMRRPPLFAIRGKIEHLETAVGYCVHNFKACIGTVTESYAYISPPRTLQFIDSACLLYKSCYCAVGPGYTISLTRFSQYSPPFGKLGCDIQEAFDISRSECAASLFRKLFHGAHNRIIGGRIFIAKRLNPSDHVPGGC